MTLPKPYYQRGNVTLYHADCLAVLPHLTGIDAVVTDPPYGIGLEYASYDDRPEKWRPLIDSLMPEVKRLARFVVMPACDRMSLAWWYAEHPPTWMVVWYKGSPGHRCPIGFNDWEPMLTWGTPPSPMHDHFQTVCGFEVDGHPCPKPIAWAVWLVERAALEGETILDPFTGSGTTGVACIQTGREFIGVELEERYCAIAARRFDEAFDSQALYAPVPKQTQSEMFAEVSA